jgi:hypothetical protein
MLGNIRLMIFLTLILCLSAAQNTVSQSPLTPKFYYLDGEQIYRYDPNLQSRELIEIGTEAVLFNASVSPDGRYLAYMEEGGVLRWIDLQTNQITTFPPRPTPPPYFWPESEPYTSHVVPLAWSSTGKLLLNQYIWEGTYLGWTSVDEPYWHDFPPRPAMPELAEPRPYPTHYGLGYEAWSPDGGKLLFASGGPGTAAVFLSGLTLIDLDQNTTRRIVAESILYPPDGTSLIAGTRFPSWSGDNQWIAFAMQVNILVEAEQIYFPYGLYVARSDGTDRKLIAQDNKTHYIGCTTWSPGGTLLYVYLNAESVIDPAQQLGELYIFDPQSEITVIAASDVRCPIGLSGDGRFLSYFQGNNLMVLSFATQEETVIVADGAGGLNNIGWTME